jgi:uncharacterized protein YcnI
MRSRTRTLGAALAAGATLALPAVADAHVTVHPNAVPAAGFTVIGVNVPNEEAKATTTRVEVRLPPGFAFVSTEPVAGWTATETTGKLATPIQTDDGAIDTQVETVTWTAAKGAGIAPGQFQRFPLSVLIPDQAGRPLAFKALQTYSDGEVVRWIGAPGSDHPAAQVAVTKASSAVADYPAGAPGTVGGKGRAATAPAAAADPPGLVYGDDSDGDDTLAVVALVVGGLGLLAGGWALVAARRRTA